ncbi:phage tail protein [Pseudenhygromyxa sp. WMMC2535]|uniref:phage tail protein n=1 Tax=Pseudenhygromyxa sp. WMMC2535 TaxID=2712867 RepID=UPI0015517F8B|nr:phage tail protein [Pseudenhygromyxa sp. WMMC2535]NVB43281.1 phage tail protein [Pseudenhygromyxa sp. WMMC2535]
MAVSEDIIRSEYPLPVYNYRVEIDGETIAFSEISGLSVAYETTTFKESPTASNAAGPRILLMPSQIQQPTISLKKGLVRKTSIAVLYDWIKTTATNVIAKKDIVVRLCDENGDPVVSWTIHNAFPTKLDAPSFDANSNDAALESMELRADKVTIAEN